MKTFTFYLITMILALGITTANAGSTSFLNDTKDKVKKAVQHHANDDGWADLSKVGKHLKKNGVKVGKLSKFTKKHKKLLKVKVDDSTMPPVTLVKLK